MTEERPTYEELEHTLQTVRRRYRLLRDGTSDQTTLSRLRDEVQRLTRENRELVKKLTEAVEPIRFDETPVIVPRGVLSQLYDSALASPYLGSGYWDREEHEAARRVAEILGIEES